MVNSLEEDKIDSIYTICKGCGKKLLKEEALIHKKIWWDDYIKYKDKHVKLWYFCNKDCQFTFLDNRGKIKNKIYFPMVT